MAGEQERLAELLCARLCHDLAGAVGAVSAGAELLADEGVDSPMAGEAISLLGDSAASMTARLRFLRLALGPSSSSAPSEARPLTVAYLEKGYPQGDWTLDWPADQAGIDSPDLAKLLLNLICLAQDSLPRGGVIVVRPRGAVPVVCSAQRVRAWDGGHRSRRAQRTGRAGGLCRPAGGASGHDRGLAAKSG